MLHRQTERTRISRAADQYVTAGIAKKKILTVIAKQNVVVVPAAQIINSSAAFELVGTGVPEHHVGAGIPARDIVTVSTVDDVRARPLVISSLPFRPTKRTSSLRSLVSIRLRESWSTKAKPIE